MENNSTNWDSLGWIMAYEEGEIEELQDIADGFQKLADRGIIWHLQGHYQRVLRDLVQQGWVTIQ